MENDMLKLGMPTLIETNTIEECAALCADCGLSFIEMNMNLPQYQVQTMDAYRLRKAAREYGIDYTIHLDENMNVADFNPDVAAAYRNSVIQTIELAKKLEIPVLNMHMIYGVYFTLPHERCSFLNGIGRNTAAICSAIGMNAQRPSGTAASASVSKTGMDTGTGSWVCWMKCSRAMPLA